MTINQVMANGLGAFDLGVPDMVQRRVRPPVP
jgi:hypothetical protein